MITQQALAQYLSELLQPNTFVDYAPNGLQVAGVSSISKIITGVTACQALLDIAVEKKAQAVLVHHGYFWKGDSPCVTGILQRRLKTLLLHEINLFAYHLPLDVHAELGNNAQLAKRLGIEVLEKKTLANTKDLLWIGQLKTPQTGEVFADHIHKILGQAPYWVCATKPTVQKIAWCTGAGQDFLQAAFDAGVDAFLTGEVSERTVHLARELDLYFYAAGHHATERYGVLALGQHLQTKFDLSCEFIDIDNPI